MPDFRNRPDLAQPPADAGGHLPAAAAFSAAEAWTLGLCLLAALAIRLVGLDRESFWFDEADAASLSRSALYDLLTGSARDDGNPQGFWVLGHGWRLLVGDADFQLRLLPALIGVASVAAIYALARQLGGVRLAQLSAFLVVINPGHIYLSQEYRGYTLLFLASVGILLTSWRYRVTRSGAVLLAYVLVAALGMYVHYYVALTVCAVNLWMLAAWRDRPLLLRWIGAQAATLVLIAPVMLWARDSVEWRVNGGSAGSLQHLAATPVTTLFGRTLVRKGDPTVGLAIIAVIALLVVAACLWQARRRALAGRSLLWIAILLPMFAAALLASLGHMQSWDDRKALTVAAPLLILMSNGLLAMRMAPRRSALGLLILLSCVSLWRYGTETNRDDWRSVGQQLRLDLRPGDAVLIAPDFELISLERYFPPVLAAGQGANPIFGFSDQTEYVRWESPRLMGLGAVPPPALAQASRIWLVRNQGMMGGVQEQRLITSGLQDQGEAHVHRFGRALEIRLYARPAAAEAGLKVQ